MWGSYGRLILSTFIITAITHFASASLVKGFTTLVHYEVPSYSTATRFSLSSDTIDRSA